jgi:uncharacterized membrane protein YfcA
VEIYQWIALAVTGVVAGVLGGMLGIGGSIIMIPVMVVLCGIGQHLAQGAAMIVNVCVAVPSAIRHLQAGAVHGRVVAAMIPAAVVGVVGGVAVSDLGVFHGAGEGLLTGLFGLCLFYVLYRKVVILARPAGEALYEGGGAATISRSVVARGDDGGGDDDNHDDDNDDRSGSDDNGLGDDNSFTAGRIGGVPGGTVVGGLAGFFGGLLGIGGGVVAVPGQQVVLHMPIRNAVANSAATMICLSIIGASYKNYLLVQGGVSLGRPVAMAAVLAPGAIVGAYIGGGLTHTVPTRYVRAVLAVVLLAAALRMTWRGLVALQAGG